MYFDMIDDRDDQPSFTNDDDACSEFLNCMIDENKLETIVVL